MLPGFFLGTKRLARKWHPLHNLSKGLWSRFGGDRNPSVSLHFHPAWGQLWDHSLEVVLGMMLNSCAAEQSHSWVWIGRRQKKSQGWAGEDWNGTLKTLERLLLMIYSCCLAKASDRHLLCSAWWNCFFFPSWYIHGEVIKQAQAASFQIMTIGGLHKKGQKQCAKPGILNRSIKLFWSWC